MKQTTVILLSINTWVLGWGVAQAFFPNTGSSFTQWCQDKTSLSAEVRKTVDVLLDEAGTDNCQQAEFNLWSRTELSIENQDITDLSPLAGLINLRTLDLSDNQITDVTPLAGLINLRTLDLSDNQITDTTTLNNALPYLTTLEVNGNPLNQASIPDVEIPFTQFCQNRNNLSAEVRKTVNVLLDEADTHDCKQAAYILWNQTELYLSENKIIDVSPLAGLTNLTKLYLSLNQIRDISPLTGLTNLTKLNLSDNQIIDISPLAGLTNLNFLVINDNQITNVSPLARLTNLKLLALNDNQITDISPLSGLTNLTRVYLKDNPIAQENCPIRPSDTCVF